MKTRKAPLKCKVADQEEMDSLESREAKEAMGLPWEKQDGVAFRQLVVEGVKAEEGRTGCL